jgi:ATP-dependent helicase IRC3
MASFEKEDFSILVTVGMATEGYDLPQVDCVLMGRQTDSERLFVQ